MTGDDLSLLDRAAYRQVREALGARLRAYYDQAQQIPLSEPLSQLIVELEKKMEADPRA